MGLFIPSRLSNAVVRTSYAAAQATAALVAFIHPDTDLGTHNPSSFGAAVNSARMTSDTIRHTLEQASFAAKCAAIFGACAAGQSALSQKRVVHAVERIADVLEKIEKRAEASTNAYLAGNEGFPVQILDFANNIASKHSSRFILVYHPSNLPTGCIQRLLARADDRDSTWTHIRPETCYLELFQDWSRLVAHIITICSQTDYQKTESILVVFPANSSTILRDFCDLPGLDPASVYFHGQVDGDGKPMTWLPEEITIGGTLIYASPNVAGLGFIGVEKKPQPVAAFFYTLIAGFLLCIAWGCTVEGNAEAAAFWVLISLVFLWNSMKAWEGETVVVRRMRKCDSGIRMINRSKDFGAGANCRFKLESGEA
ncbi:hypothetical protein C8R45DRAFT_973394 [Mycena sanguinolenta]|nr:hypothetical protein C8R45DRAFT_973394 [Mycena sanguinolenta]